jgi:hypothetical protein
VAFDLLENLLRHLVHGQSTGHRNQTSFARVILGHWTSLGIVSLQTFPDHVLAIIVTSDQLGTVEVAKFIDSRRLKMDVINVSTDRAGPASSKPEQ